MNTIKIHSYTSGTQKSDVFRRRRAEPADNRQLYIRAYMLLYTSMKNIIINVHLFLRVWWCITILAET